VTGPDLSSLSGTSIHKTYRVRGRRAPGTSGAKGETIHAVDDVTISVEANRTVAIVGESGSGKTTMGRILAGLEAADRGEVRMNRIRLGGATAAERKDFRRSVQMVFQDPYGSLDPRYTVGATIDEPLAATTTMSKSERRERIRAVLNEVGLGPASRYEDMYPSSLSGGQRQRVAIGRAIANKPKFIIADEPVSMLDVSLQAGILALFRSLQSELRCGYVFITHDLGVARYVADDIAVMYRGRIVEFGSRDQVIDRPAHPYTRLLLSIVREDDTLDPGLRIRQKSAEGRRVRELTGCAFRPRCPFATEACGDRPTLTQASSGGTVACFHPQS
jgi:dipeptide transport system ATP-binding protein